ncbi:MAG: hypothetical protein ACREYE_29035, partial [Gammaproteobacteria bacterium]
MALPNKAKDVDFLVPDGRGGLWIGEDKTLIKLDREGEVQFQRRPFSGPGSDKLVALIADPVDGSVWVASKERITKLSAEGERQQSFTPGSEVVNFSIFAAISRREGIPAPVRQARVECRLALAKPANSPQ